MPTVDFHALTFTFASQVKLKKNFHQSRWKTSPWRPSRPTASSSRHCQAHRPVAKSYSSRTRRLPECEIFCETLLALLNAAHDAVLAHDDQCMTLFCKLIKDFMKILHRKPLLERPAGGETAAYTFRGLNAKVGEIYEAVGLERNQRAEDWERGCDFQAQRLRQLVETAAPRMLINEMRGEKQVTKTMLDMYTWLEGGTPGRINELKRVTLERLRVFLGLEARVITTDTVAALEQQPTNILSIFRFCRLGSVALKAAAVLVRHSKASEHCSSSWRKSPARRPFFVCEDAHGGDIVKFFSKEDNRELFWSRFLQVAQGLRTLHERRIVHEVIFLSARTTRQRYRTSTALLFEVCQQGSANKLKTLQRMQFAGNPEKS
ncbi:unnamed protein product [Phytophthora lilii]|uniref:Unnamed protein product n=1 Tax=Phytophthora lilii TaxID=2077276 RepID=A0A9W7D8A6_9STRA|nr:unnamed protein product [Phytophthora lilii]